MRVARPLSHCFGHRGPDKSFRSRARIAYEVDADRFFKLMFDLLRDPMGRIYG
jgi:hypothetical protein